MSKVKEQEELLENLVKEAQSHPVYSIQHRQAIEKLLRIISKELDSLYYLYSKNRTEEYEVAKQEILLYIYRNIDRYDPKYSLKGWVFSIFKYRLFDAIKDINKQSISYVPIDELEFSISQIEEPPSVIELIINYIEEDPEDIFKNTHIRGCPEANIRKLLLLRLDGYSWISIAKDLNVSAQTISSFYHRSLLKLVPKIKEYLHHIGAMD